MMQSVNLLVICCMAFIGVFVVLCILAVVMHLINVFFPDRGKGSIPQTGSDNACLAAISATFKSFCPGKKISKIEEEK